jgi:hypothetical protein
MDHSQTMNPTAHQPSTQRTQTPQPSGEPEHAWNEKNAAELARMDPATRL